MGHYPAIDVLNSVSRLCSQLSTAEDLAAARKLRAALAMYEESRDLLEIGAYVPGTNPRLDHALRLEPEISTFLRQDVTQNSSRADTLGRMHAIATRL